MKTIWIWVGALFILSGQAMAASPYQWRLADDVAHNGDSRTLCFAFDGYGQVLNGGNPIPDSYCGYPKPDLAQYRWMLGDQVAHNGDYRTLCFAINPSNGKVLNLGNPVLDTSKCGPIPPNGYQPGSTYAWRLGDDIAHNGDARTLCFAFNSYGQVLNAGNPIPDSYCPSPKPDLALYRWILADQVAHNGDYRTLCYATNPATGAVLNLGNPVDSWHCSGSPSGPVVPPGDGDPNRTWVCSTRSNGRSFSVPGRGYEETRSRVVQLCVQNGFTVPAECDQNASCQ